MRATRRSAWEFTYGYNYDNVPPCHFTIADTYDRKTRNRFKRNTAKFEDNLKKSSNYQSSHAVMNYYSNDPRIPH